jgi:hypothetical protein
MILKKYKNVFTFNKKMFMKKLIILFAVILFASSSYAQEKGAFRAQAGLVYGGDTELGINGGVQYFVSEKIAIAPSYSFFLKDFGGIKYSSLNIEGRYYFNQGWYGLAGFDILRTSGSINLFGTPVNFSGSSTEIALGAGYDLELSSGTMLNLQAKYANQIVLGGGIVFSF